MQSKSFLALSEVKELIRLRKYEEAEKILLEMSGERPEDEYIAGSLFNVYLKQGTFDKAEKTLNQILQKQPDNYFFLSRKGDLLSASNKPRQALEIFNNLYNTKKDPYVGWRLANEYYKLRKFDKADYYFSQTIARLFDQPGLYFLGYLIKKSLQKYDDAKDLLDSAINYSSNPKQYLSEKMKFEAEVKGVSAKQWEKSIKFSQHVEDPAVNKKLAEQFLEEKNYQKAEKYYQKILKIENTDYNKSRLGYVYYKWEKYDLALAIFLEMPLKTFLTPSFIAMVIKSAHKTDQQNKVILHLQAMLEKNPEAKQLYGAIKKLKIDNNRKSQK